MTTYSTGNPIGSKDPRDLYDNAENLDEAVNTRQAESWDDRFGVARKTWWGMEQDFQQFLIDSGYVNIGDYAAGLEITARNQIFWRDGELYRAGASLDLPYTTTGDWGTEEGLFVAVGDASLRQDLVNPDKGASMVARGVVAVDSIVDLLALPYGMRKEDLRYLVKGYHAGSDVGGGEFYWDSSRQVENDYGAVINGWVRRVASEVSIQMFGIDEGLADNALRLQACLNLASTLGVPVVSERDGTFVLNGNITVPSGVTICTGKGVTFQRAGGLTGDFFSMGDNSSLKEVVIDGNRQGYPLVSTVPYGLVRVGDSDNVSVSGCTIRGSSSYGVVVNTGLDFSIIGNEIHDFYEQGVAVFGDGTSICNHEIKSNIIYDIGWGAISIQNVQYCLIKENHCEGVYIGGRNGSVYVNASGNTISWVSGPTFENIRVGGFVVLNSGVELRIVEKPNETTVLVEPAVGELNNVPALLGTGDIIGVQSCWYTDVVGNTIENCTTFGTGGGTMSGNAYSMGYCRYISNRIRNTGKNGINITQAETLRVDTVSLLENELINCANGGLAVSSFDRIGIAFHEDTGAHSGGHSIAGNKVYTWGGEGQAEFWLGFGGGRTPGTVFIGANHQEGHFHAAIFNDVISIDLIGWGDSGSFTDFASYGGRLRVSVRASGSNIGTDPSVTISKVTFTGSEEALLAQNVTTSGPPLVMTWGLQLSGKGNLVFSASGTPVDGGIYTFHVSS